MPFPKDALTVILNYVTKHEGSIGAVLGAAMAILNWLVGTFGPEKTAAAGVSKPEDLEKAVGFAFPSWLIPIILNIIGQILKPKALMAAAPPKSDATAASAKKLEAYIACEGKEAA